MNMKKFCYAKNVNFVIITTIILCMHVDSIHMKTFRKGSEEVFWEMRLLDNVSLL